LDTNVLVSALVFEGRLAWIREAWKTGRLTPLVTHDSVDELIRVLAYPKFRLEPDEIESFLEDILPHAEAVEIPPSPTRLALRCPDPDDRKFVSLAEAAGADVLVTGDPDLLELAAEAPFPIVSPADLRSFTG
jgi:hypothetical protein